MPPFSLITLCGLLFWSVSPAEGGQRACDAAWKAAKNSRILDYPRAAIDHVHAGVNAGLNPDTDSFSFLVQQYMPYPVDLGGGRGAFVCIPNKNGCSAWRALALKAEGVTERGIMIHSKYARFIARKYRPYVRDTDAWLALMTNKSMPRVFFARNPYSRVLSAYLNKFVQEQRTYGLKISANASFAEYVMHLYSIYRTRGDLINGLVDAHFALQTSFCGIRQGIAYDWILPVEGAQFWYPCLVDELGLADLVSSGWPGPGGCFMRVGGTCDLDAASADAIANGTSFDDSSGMGHHTSARSHLASFYTPELTQLVNEMYAMDFALLGYPTDNPFLVQSPKASRDDGEGAAPAVAAAQGGRRRTR